MRFTIHYSRIQNNRSKGFTLVEMIVAIAIFMIVAVVAVGSLVRIVALNRQAQTLQASVNNVGFALDSMSREIRQGSSIACQASYGGGDTTLYPNVVSGDCETIQGGNQVVMFQTAKSDPSNTSCKLYNAYWFKSINGNGSAPYSLMKAQQTFCNQQMTETGIGGTAVFYPIVDTGSVTLTGYNLAVFAGAPSFVYKWVFVRLQGYSGVRAEDINTFDIQTSVSQRVND